MADGASRLLEAALSLSETLDPSRLFVRVCEQVVRVVGAERADLYLTGRGGSPRLEATYGRPGAAIGAAGEGIVAAVAERGEPVSGGSTLAVPLSWGGELRGALVAELAAASSQRDEALDLLSKLAQLAAGACRNATEHAELALEARTDGLTGCLNHAAMQDTLRRELERCSRTGHGLSLAIVDLDDFKQVNEQHGHQAGDEVLKHVGSALRDSMRTYDVVARYGGDEFAVIALDASEEVTVDVVARGLGEIRGRLGALGYASRATIATAGVAEWRPGDSPTMLIARADEALLYGKHDGPRGTPIRASSVPASFGEARRPSG